MHQIKRNCNVELLRIISMLLIVIYHFQARTFNLYVVGNERIGEADFFPEIILHSIGKLGVPIFVFISGYYGIKFKWKRLWEMMAMTAIYAVVSVGLYALIYGGASIKNLLVVTNHWWFMTAYICLYILSDGINHLIENTSKWNLLVITLIFYYISFGDIIVSSANIGGLYLMLTMYISARWIKLYFMDTINKHCLLLLVLLFVVRFGTIALGYNTHHLGILPYINSYVNPLTMLTAACLFCCFLQMRELRFRKATLWLSSSALAVYLLSEGPCGQRLFISLFPGGGNWNILHFLSGALITYLIIAVIDKVRMLITDRFVLTKIK